MKKRRYFLSCEIWQTSELQIGETFRESNIIYSKQDIVLKKMCIYLELSPWGSS